MTEQQKQDARERRRATDPRKTALTELTLVNPNAYVEARQLEYVKQLEDIAVTAKAAGNLQVARQAFNDLLRLTPLGHPRLDVTAQQLEKAEVPDLSMLSGDQLIEIIKLSQGKTGPITIELPEKTEGNGHRTAAEEGQTS